MWIFDCERSLLQHEIIDISTENYIHIFTKLYISLLSRVVEIQFLMDKIITDVLQAAPLCTVGQLMRGGLGLLFPVG
jgi:Mor family transcriptional regulator